MRDSTQIENLAVSRIVEIFSSCKRITPWLKIGDREPLWDGSLYLYDSDIHNNSGICGRVSCQVKGMDVDKETETESYYLSQEDLSNYLRDGGVLFFLVHVGVSSKPGYWAKLTPVELRRYLKEINDGQQKGKCVEFTRMTTDLAKCEAQVFEFHQHCQLQKAPPIKIDKVAKAGSKFHVVGVAQNGQHPIVALSEGLHYLYACDENDQVTNVIGDSQYSFQLSREVDDCIAIGEKTFRVPIRMFVANGESYLKVGEFMRIDVICNNGDGRKLNFSADDVKGVRERSLALEVLIALADADTFSFPKLQLSMSCAEITLPEDKRQAINNELANVQKVVGLLNRLHISSDLVLDSLSKKDMAELNTLYHAIMEDKTVNPGQTSENIIKTNVTIGALSILVWLIRTVEGYYVKDFFGTNEYEIAIEKDGSEEKVAVNRFALLSSEDYQRLSNIDWLLIPSDYKNLNLHIPEVAQQVNQDVLNLLTAFDNTNRQEILDAALRLTDWLCDSWKDISEFIIYRINNLQAIKRNRPFTEAELREIASVSDDKDASTELKFCCDLLLDDQRRADYHFSILPKDTQAFYKTLPISRFWDHRDN